MQLEPARSDRQPEQSTSRKQLNRQCSYMACLPHGIVLASHNSFCIRALHSVPYHPSQTVSQSHTHISNHLTPHALTPALPTPSTQKTQTRTPRETTTNERRHNVCLARTRPQHAHYTHATRTHLTTPRHEKNRPENEQNKSHTDPEKTRNTNFNQPEKTTHTTRTETKQLSPLRQTIRSSHNQEKHDYYKQ